MTVSVDIVVERKARALRDVDVAAALDEVAGDLATKVVVLRAEGKGFNAGVDIKEMQATEGFDALKIPPLMLRDLGQREPPIA